MIVTILTDNTAGGIFLAEHGLSFLIEHQNTKLLFDTGHSDVFIKNAQKMGIQLNSEIKTVILSHGHWDHGNGLRYLNGQQLITHPKSFIQRYRNKDNSNIGLALSKTKIEDKFELTLSETPYAITDKLIFLGEIPRITTFESTTTTFTDNHGQPDFVPDDSALAMVDKNGLTIIAGCAHAGICNIVLHAIKVTGISKVKTVMGGFHLKHNNLQTKETINFFKQHNIYGVYPSHCTGLEALAAFVSEFNIKQVKTGNIYRF